MKKLIVILTIGCIVFSGHHVFAENHEECEVKDSETCKKLNQSEILAVLVNSSKIQLNNSDDVTEFINLDYNNITLEQLEKIGEQDQYFFAARRRACLENVTTCLAEGELSFIF